MGDTPFERSWWPGLLLWCALYISDYYCTLAAARSYRLGANQHIVFEGSYELNPIFQKDIDTLRRLSPRFVVMLLITSALLVVEFFATRFVPQLAFVYELVFGALVLLECFIHLRHFRNLYLFRRLQRPGAIEGQLRYGRVHMLSTSASEGLAFAGVYLLLAGVLGSWFFLGGALSSFGIFVRHRAQARRLAARSTSATQSSG